jgi:CRP-like cAMP-binding protein
MSTAERGEILDMMQLETYPAGKMILQEGQSTQNLWIIVNGHCQVLKENKNGGKQELATLEKCCVFGEMSFFHLAPHSASVRSLTEVQVLRFPRENYDPLLATSFQAAHKLALNTIAVLAERVRTMDNWTCDLVEKAEAGKHREEWRDFRSKLYTEWQF